MKNKKGIPSALVYAAILTACVLGLAACGTGQKEEPKEQTTVMEEMTLPIEETVEEEVLEEERAEETTAAEKETSPKEEKMSEKSTEEKPEEKSGIKTETAEEGKEPEKEEETEKTVRKESAVSGHKGTAEGLAASVIEKMQKERAVRKEAEKEKENKKEVLWKDSGQEILKEKKFRNGERAKAEQESGSNYEIKTVMTALQEGSYGEVIQSVQKELIKGGYLQDAADGSYGPKTAEAVRKYQEENGIAETGLGEQTLRGLGFDSEKILNSVPVISVDYNDSRILGTGGRLYIPSDDLSVAVYWCDYEEASGMNAQAITNAWDSAYAFYRPSFVIGDHNNQEFVNLPNTKEGADGYYVDSNGKLYHMTCIGTGTGTNDGYNIYDQNGTSWTDWEYDLVTYTSTGDWKDLYLAEWEFDEE